MWVRSGVLLGAGLMLCVFGVFELFVDEVPNGLKLIALGAVGLWLGTDLRRRSRGPGEES